ncbi:Tripartite tricarboxylate transporter family receptor [compost metagenome]
MPAGTPPAIVSKVNAEVNRLLAMPEVKDAIQAQGAEPQAMSVANFDKMFKADFKASKQLVEESGAKIQ